MRKIITALFTFIVMVGSMTTVSFADTAENEKTAEAYEATGDYLESLGTPVTGNVGGEWMALGLLRSGRSVDEGYYDSVVEYVEENCDGDSRIHHVKSTENSRLIIALTAMGKDVTDVEGYNLLKGLNDLEYVEAQGLNGPIWALIAFDSGHYPMPEGTLTREDLISTILEAQNSDGGWALTGDAADPDMTGMALQALAPYCPENEDVSAAVEKALECLSAMQDEDGGFSTSFNGGKTATSESIAQVVVALTALDIDPDTDERFVKNGSSAMDALLTYFV